MNKDVEKTLDEFNELLQEYDARYSGQNVPYGPADTSNTSSEPSVIAPAGAYKPHQTPDAGTEKAFQDEERAIEDAMIMPYTLDRATDELVKAFESMSAVKEMLRQTADHPSLAAAQKYKIKQMFSSCKKLLNSVKKLAHDLDDLLITRR